MAPGVRSGRRTGHPKVSAAAAVVVGAGGEDAGGRLDAGGEGRCLRTRWRAGAAGMLGNCVLSVGMLLLVVRCAVAAEEKPTFDASGSSSLPSDHAVTAASAHPLADLSVAEEVPFSVVHRDGDSESEGEGLPGRPAFSSVLTVMAGTVKHPVSLDQSRTLPTITRDDTHTTQWPSHSSSQGSEMSSFSSSASSGLTSDTFHQRITSSQTSATAPSVSEPPHVSLMSVNLHVSSSSSLLVSSLPLSSSVSPSSQSTSSVLPSFLSLFLTSVGRTNHSATSQDERWFSSSIHQTDATMLPSGGSVGWTESTRTTESNTQSFVNISAVTKSFQNTKQFHNLSKTSYEKSNKLTKHSLYSPAAITHSVGGRYSWSVSTEVVKTPATSTYTPRTNSNHGQTLPNIISGHTQTQTPSTNSVNSFPLQSDSQGVQMQLRVSQNLRSPQLSVSPKSYSAASRVTEQTLNPTAYAKNENEIAADSQKNVGDAIITPVSSHDRNPTESFRTTGSFLTVSPQSLLGRTSLSEIAITKLTHILSGTVSSEHASNPGDLLMAAGHGSPRDLAININYNQREVAGAELKSISTHPHLSNSLSPTQTRPESTTGSVLKLIAGTGTTSSTSESDPLDLPSNGGRYVKDFVTQTGSPMGMTQRPGGWMTASFIFPSKSREMTFSGSAIPVASSSRFEKDVSQEPQSFPPTWPTYSLPLILSFKPKRNKTDDNTGLSDHTKALLLSPVTPSQRSFQTRSLLSFPHRLYTTSGQSSASNKSQQIAEISAHTRESLQAGDGTPLTLGYHSNIKTLPASSDNTTEKEMPAVSFERNGTKSSISPLLNGNEEPTLIRHTTFYKQGAPLVQFTTQLSSLNTAKDAFMFNKRSEVSFVGSPNETPFPTVTLNVPSEPHTTLSRNDDVTLVSHYQQISASITTPRTNSLSLSQGPVTSARSDKSDFYAGKPTSIPSTASYSDGQESRETFGAIFSLGTKQMAPYTKWKATKPVPFQSTAVELETTSIGFDRAHTNVQADGPWYEHPKLEERQESNVLNSADSTIVATEQYLLYPTAGEHRSLTYIKSSSGYEEQNLNLSPAKLRSDLAVDVQQGASENPPTPLAQGSEVSLALFHSATDPVPLSQDSSLASVYDNQHRGPLADAHSAESAFDTAATLSNSPGHSISDIDEIKHTADSRLRRFTLPTELVPSPSETLPLSYRGIKAAQLSSLQMSVSSKAPSSLPSSLSLNPAVHPGFTSSSVTVKAVPDTTPSSSQSLALSVDPNPSEEMTQTFVVLTEAGADDLTAGTSRAVALTFPKEKVSSLAPSQSVRTTLSAGPTERTSQVSPLPPQQDPRTTSVEVTTTTVASTTKMKDTITTMPFLRVTTLSTTTTTPQPTPVTRRTTTTTIRTQTSRRIFTPPVPRTSPPRTATTVFISPFTTTTEAPPQQCNITERLWVKTVVSIYVRRNRLDSIQRQNLRRGLSQGLRKALNDSSAQAQVETVFGSPNMTVAYHVTGGDMVYVPSVVLEGLDSYGRDKLIADLRQYLPMVTALPLPVTLWRSSPAVGFQLKTVLQFVGAGDDPRSCRFSQMMEQRLEKVFSEAQVKVLNVNSRLSVQMLSVSQAAGSPAVSLVYTVKNGSVFLNGTTASNLLGQLSAELVGYFLFYPPLIIAEPLEYHNLNTSVATRDLWVITVIQDVDNASLEGQYQSFASLMEQRLAELFVLAGQQGTRFRRATAVDSYTVQMVSIRRVSGIKNPAEMTYYVQHNGVPLSGTSAAKVLNTVDSQTMALTLGYFVQLQAEPVVKNPPNNLWILAAVLAPIAVVTLIIIIITAVLCRKNKNDFKADAIGNLNPRAKMAYRRDVGYYHQPVQGFDYAKQHLGQQGGDEETLPASQDTLVMSLQIRDTPLSLEKALQQDGTASKKSLTSDKHKSKLPSEDGSVISNESEKLNSSRALTVLKVTAQQKLTKEETCKRDDPYDTSSGSLQLISIKPTAAQPNYSHAASSDRSHESAIVNGEVNLALKQKSDIEHYRNKLRLKAKRKGYYDFPSTDGSSSGRALSQRQQHGFERAAGEHGRPLEPDDERGSTFVKSHRRHSQIGQTAYRSRQSLSSPSPGGTEMDLLVMRERPRRGIRNSGYDTEPELIEETNVDRLMGQRGYMYGRGLKGHSETSTLSSQPSIDEVRQQMHLLLEEAFSLASGGQSTSGRHSHHHRPPPEHYSPGPPPLPYADVVTSAPGTMTSGRGGLQWVPSYGSDVYQCSLPKPAFHFTQLPEMAMGSPPPLPPRTGPPPGTSLRRSTSDLGPKGRSSETSVTEMQNQHDSNPYGPTTRAALPPITAEQPVSKYSGNPITAVYAIPASRTGYSEYFVSTPPTSYHSPSWMSYPPEPEDVPPQWADSLPLPGYVEAFPHPRYPQGSPTRLPLEYNPALEPPPAAPSTASKQSLPQVVKDMDSMPLSSLSTSALVQAIRQEVAKLAKKQNDLFEF